MEKQNAISLMDLLTSADVATTNKNWYKFRDMVNIESMIKYAEIGEEKELNLNLNTATCWQYL